MAFELQTVLILFALFQIKHTLADYFFQTQRMLNNRSIYVHFGRLQHVCVHAALSFVIVLLVGLPLTVAIILAAIDLVLHFHIDWLKGRHSERVGEDPNTKEYWRAFGVDQLAHQLTYLGMIWLWLAVFA